MTSHFFSTIVALSAFGIGGCAVSSPHAVLQNTVQVRFATDRYPLKARPWFSNERSNQKRLEFGIATVSVRSPVGKPSRAAGIGTMLKSPLQPVQKPLIYTHGYNTSFESAVGQAAELACDLERVDGSFGKADVIAYTWPSRGVVFQSSYIADHENAEWTHHRCTEFLRTIAERSGKQPNVVAHSMGCRVVVWALSRLALTSEVKTTKPFNQLVLLGPDIDEDVFSNYLNDVSRIVSRITVYVSSRDVAIKLAERVRANASRRLTGRAVFGWRHRAAPTPVTFIGTSGLAGGPFGHSYNHMKIRADICRVLQDVEPLEGERSNLIEDYAQVEPGAGTASAEAQYPIRFFRIRL